MHNPREDTPFVLVHRRRPREIVYVRDYPDTAKHPTPAQRRIRILFGEAARKTRGIRYRGRPDLWPLPPAALAVRRELYGVRILGSGRRVPKWYARLRAMIEALSPETRKIHY